MYDRTKTELVAYLRAVEHEQERAGLRLLEHVWTCEFPARFTGPERSGFRACRTCPPCVKAIEAGLLPDEARTYKAGETGASKKDESANAPNSPRKRSQRKT